MYEKVGKDHIGFDMFGKVNKYAESDVVPMEEVPVIGDGAEVETAVVNQEIEQKPPVAEIEIPVGDENIAEITVAVEYAEKASKFAESMIATLESGAAAVVEDGEMKVGSVETMPESKVSEDGVSTLKDVNEGRIEEVPTTPEDDGSFE